jgi:hypothetical protein
VELSFSFAEVEHIQDRLSRRCPEGTFWKHGRVALSGERALSQEDQCAKARRWECTVLGSESKSEQKAGGGG